MIANSVPFWRLVLVDYVIHVRHHDILQRVRLYRRTFSPRLSGYLKPTRKPPAFTRRFLILRNCACVSKGDADRLKSYAVKQAILNELSISCRVDNFRTLPTVRSAAMYLFYRSRP